MEGSSGRSMLVLACGVLLGAACGLDAVGTMGAPPSDAAKADGAAGPPGDGSADDAGIDGPVPPSLPGFSEQRLLTIDNTKYGALTDFPLLVSLDASRIDFAKARPSGEDLRFTDASGSLLAHEIESFGGGRAIVWVRVPAIAASAKTYVWMFYGNAQAEDAQTPASVWDSGFVGVFHMRDAKDSTGIHKGAANGGGQPAAGKIGPALRFDGSSQYMDTDSHEELATFTLDVWFSASKAPDQSGWYGPLMRDQNYGIGWDCNPTWWPKSAQAVSIYVAASGDGGPCLQSWCRAVFADPSGADALAAGAWHHLVATYDGAKLATYTDGKLRDEQTVGGPPAKATGSAKVAANMGLDRFFAGTVDEVRISKVVRSVDWIAAQHASMIDAYVRY